MPDRNVRTDMTAIAMILLGGAAFANPPFKLNVLSDLSQVAPGGTATIIFSITPEKGWHFYWKNPGDSGNPPLATWTLPSGWTGSRELQFPAPNVFVNQQDITYGFGSRTLLAATVTVPNSAKLGPQKIAGTLSVMICRELCRVDKVPFSVPITVGKSAVPGSGAKVATEARQQTGFDKISCVFQMDGDSYVLVCEAPAEMKSAYFFPFNDTAIKNEPERKVEVSGGKMYIFLPKSEFATKPLQVLDGVLQVKTIDKTVNYIVSASVKAS